MSEKAQKWVAGRYHKIQDMGLGSFAWMRQDVVDAYDAALRESREEITELEQKVVHLTLELSRLRVKPIVDKEIAAEAKERES